MQKIAHLIATNFYGGPEKQVLEHLKRLEDGFKGTLVSFVESDAPNEILGKAREARVNQIGIPMRGALDASVLFRLINVLRAADADLVCTHGYKSTVMGCLASRRMGVPTIAFSRGYTSETVKVAFYEWLDRCVLNHVDGVVCVSEGQRQTLESLGIRGKRTWVVHNAVELPVCARESTFGCETFLEDVGVTKGVTRIVYGGRLSPEKGVDFLLEAAKIVDHARWPCQFVICGDGLLRDDLSRKATNLGLTEKVRFLGFRRDFLTILSAADVVVLPSLTEGLPNVVLEAFAHRKPVVATDVGGVPEVVSHGRSGFLVPPRRADRLAEALIRCLSSSELRRSMGEEGHQTVKAKFGFDEQMRKLRAIYGEVLC